MKVYIITVATGEGAMETSIKGVYSNKERAEKNAAKLAETIRIQQYYRKPIDRDFVSVEEWDLL
jgi:hypothetical protein